ncbi:MAG: energy transducer TonB [Pseudomonadota bacterium]
MFKRLIPAFIGACGVVFVLTAISASLIQWWDDRERSDDPVQRAQPVSLLSGYSSLDLAELLGEPRYQLPSAPTPLPPPPLAARKISGFVIVEVTVNAEGRAINATIAEAEPAGWYEQQALREALAGSYPSGSPGTRDTVIRFSVDAAEGAVEP